MKFFTTHYTIVLHIISKMLFLGIKPHNTGKPPFFISENSMLMIFLRKPRILNNISIFKIRDQKYEIKNTRSKIRDQKYEAIIWKVVWSWVGMRAFSKNALVPPTPILLVTEADVAIQTPQISWHHVSCPLQNKFRSYAKRKSHKSKEIMDNLLHDIT